MSLDRTNLEKYIPQEMKEKRQWVFHRVQKNEETGHFDKNMINPYNGRFASCADSTHWADFNTAIKQANKYDGNGITFVLKKEDNITCIDLDCAYDENGEMKDLTKTFVETFKDTYIEKSVSGKGLHIFVKGNLLENARKKNITNGVEMYDDKRFISMTGNSINDCNKLLDCEKTLQEFNVKYIGKPIEPITIERSEASKSDTDIINLIRRGRQRDKFDRLYSGNAYAYSKNNGSPDYSSADFALVSIIAFYTQDKTQIDSIYRTSGLYAQPREKEKGIKWHKRIGNTTYGELTIDNALCSLPAVYNPCYNKSSKIKEQKETTEHSR